MFAFPRKRKNKLLTIVVSRQNVVIWKFEIQSNWFGELNQKFTIKKNKVKNSMNKSLTCIVRMTKLNELKHNISKEISIHHDGKWYLVRRIDWFCTSFSNATYLIHPSLCLYQFLWCISYILNDGCTLVSLLLIWF